MPKYSSSSHASSTSTSGYSKPHDSIAEARRQYDEWITEFTRPAVEAHEADGLPIIDFTTETPNTHLSTTFPCNPSIRGRLTPYPFNSSLYVLDFISNNNIRFERDTKLVVYDVGDYGGGNPQELQPMGTLPGGRRGSIDMFVLNPHRVVELRRRDTDQLIKTIKFVATSLVDGRPQFEPVI